MIGFMPWPLYFQGRSPWYPLNRRLGGPQSHSGHDIKKGNSQPLPGIKLFSSESSSHLPCKM